MDSRDLKATTLGVNAHTMVIVLPLHSCFSVQSGCVCLPPPRQVVVSFHRPARPFPSRPATTKFFCPVTEPPIRDTISALSDLEFDQS